MTNQQYPNRGEMSEDGKFYTHTDGTVHQRAEPVPAEDWCSFCSVEWLDHGRKPCEKCEHVMWSVKGAYVPSTEERVACEMAMAQIIVCQEQRGHNCSYRFGQSVCSRITERTCPARKYLAAHGDENAWSVQ